MCTWKSQFLETNNQKHHNTKSIMLKLFITSESPLFLHHIYRKANYHFSIIHQSAMSITTKTDITTLVQKNFIFFIYSHNPRFRYISINIKKHHFFFHLIKTLTWKWLKKVKQGNPCIPSTSFCSLSNLNNYFSNTNPSNPPSKNLNRNQRKNHNIKTGFLETAEILA